MKYELDRLGPDNFENMIQSLIRGFAGIPAIIFGDGPDGQREAVIESATFKVGSAITVSGRTVVQAKYKSPNGKEKEWDWLRENLKSELEKFKEKSKVRPYFVPDSFLFFTNIVFTPVLDSGIRDKAEKFVEDYKDIIPNIFLFGADDIRTFLENNRDVATSYLSFILPGDVLTELNDYLKETKNEKFEDLVEYACQMFREDSAVRLEQAGNVSDNSINIRNVYTDLGASPLEGHKEDIDEIASYIISLGNKMHKRVPTNNPHDTPGVVPQIIKAPEHNIVLIGNAGQGKSTLCQYICQIYRAALLQRFSRNVPGIQNYFDVSLPNTVPRPQCERFPICINLKKYAAWVNMLPEGSNSSVVSYIISLIVAKTGSAISIHEFRKFLSSYSWIFMFDGLDEVPASANRSDVLKQIQEFLTYDLVEASCDSIVVCTSRPQGYDDAFSHHYYRHFKLQYMSKELCRKYIQNLLLYLEENTDMRSQYTCTLNNALNDPMVSKLMTTPLYTAIIVLLVKMGGTPPTKRYALFQEYCEIVIKREQQKKMLPTINNEFEWIKALHSQIGFLLQAESESKENTAAELSSLRFKEIIIDYLKKEGFDDNAYVKAEEIYAAITKRLSFLSEVSSIDHKDCVVFPLRSIQEYFAAEWLISFNDEDKLSEALELISTSSYWRNVYLFVAGYFAKNIHRKNINETLFRICQCNNGDENYIEPGTEVADAFKIAQQGSRLALDVLCENLYSRPKDYLRYLNLVSNLLDREENIEQLVYRLLQLPDKISETFIQDKVIPFVQTKKKADSLAFCFLWAKANSGDSFSEGALLDVLETVSPPSAGTVYLLLTFGFSSLNDKLLNNLFNWVTERYFSYFCRAVLTDQEYYGLIYHYYDRFPDEDITVSVIRQIIYRSLCNRGYDESEQHDVHPHFATNPMLVEFISDEYELYFSPKKIKSSNGLYFRSKYRLDDDSQLQKYSKLFHSNQLYEVEALMECIAAPSTETLKHLLTEYCNLPSVFKYGFSELVMHCSTWLSEIFIKFDVDGSVDSILENYTDNLFASEFEKEKEIIDLVHSEDILGITNKKYWDSVLSFSIFAFPTDKVVEIVDTIKDENISSGFFDFLHNAVKSCKTKPVQINDFYYKHFSLMFNGNYGPLEAFQLYDMLPSADLINGDIVYPNLVPTSWMYYHDDDNLKQRVLEKVYLISSFGSKNIEAYSLIPYLSNPSTNLKLRPFATEDIFDTYEIIKASENQAAIFGYMLRILCGPVSLSIKHLIKEDLLKILDNRSNALCLYSTIPSCSLSGKLVLYEILYSLNENNLSRANFLEPCALSILKDIEAMPTNQDALIKLVSDAHE